MPAYEYECRDCGKMFETVQSFDEYDRHQDHERHQRLKCPKCGSTKLEHLVASSVQVITPKKS